MTSLESTQAAIGPAGHGSPAPHRASASWHLAEGARFADRRVALAPLGGGERYEVYLARDERLGARAVAKLLRPHLVSDPAALASLRHEAQVLALAAHPGLVTCLSAVLDGPCPHLLLELVEGPSLARLLKRHGVIALDRLLPMALRVARALEALAGRGFVHLDLKPTHVIAGADPRVVGFSAARPVGAAAPVEPGGGDAYLAPERCDGTAPADPSADVFALGAVLHHALRGAAPFPRGRGGHASGDPALRFPQLHAAPAALPRRLPEALRSLVAAMLARDPAARPHMGEVAAALEPLSRALPPPRGRAAARGQPASERNVRTPKSDETIQERSASASATRSARQNPIP